MKHSSVSKPEELPGALSQNRGLERKAFPLPADELTLLQVKRLKACHQRNWAVLRAGRPEELRKQNMEDNFYLISARLLLHLSELSTSEALVYTFL